MSRITSEFSRKRLASKPYVLWQIDFARVFKDKGGFDIVIGNPPYRICQPSNTEAKLLDYYKKKYLVASYKIDLFHLFFEKGIKLLKMNGVLGYITPNTYLTNKYIKPLRKYILDTCVISKIVNHDKVFTAASVDTATIIMSKSHADDSDVTVLKSTKFAFEEVCKKKQIDWENDKEYIFNINEETAVSFINCVELGKVCKTYFGIQAYDRKSSIADIKINEHYLPLIDGGDIQPYTYAQPNIYFNYIPNNIKSGGDWKVYSQERVVVRQIGQIPVVGLCEANILASNTLYSVYISDESYQLKFILACLNSDVIKEYWKSKYSDNKALFPKIKGFQLKELPIPRVTLGEQDKVVKLVDSLLLAKQTNDAKAEEIEKIINKQISSMYLM